MAKYEFDPIGKVSSAIIDAAGYPRCMDEKCSCVGDNVWNCLLGTTPRRLSRAAVEAVLESLIEYSSDENLTSSCDMAIELLRNSLSGEASQ